MYPVGIWALVPSVRAFCPTIVKGNVTPEDVEEVHLIKEGEEEEEGGDGEETSL